MGREVKTVVLPTFVPPRSFSPWTQAEVKGEVRQVDRRSTGECISDFFKIILRVRLLGPSVLRLFNQ